ncbi:hypothetical protein ULMS_24290 [Patiriisocius marinistellae]|uniref:Putative auto-transporter adhesin head GIN domain-containing protein n=1 Tax=Patiriisocius marinistellae TaxID=2494560 RepID=A0A5J4G3I0_9FLAO|nr:head GIN domain-containing protein [Patiriisocius marinistellae]GEQ86921.1 hypothetical protein ULMS_24290 [Patiriisocius marinistellae]
MKKKTHIIQKALTVFTIVVLLISCNSENGSDCFQSAGTIVETNFTVAPFSEIRVEGEVTLTIVQGEVQEVIVETGENLLSDVQVTVEGDILVIRDDNTCNFVRDYGVTKATVTTPVLTKIQNSSSSDVTGVGQLTFPKLTLQSNTSGGLADPLKGGDFYVNVACDELRVSANGQSIFYVSGSASTTIISFLDENPRFEGRDLAIENLEVFQRSANKIIVNPLNEIKGAIVGTGDVISINRPPIVEVEERFTGRLIFE